MNRNTKQLALIALIPLCFVLSGCGRLGGAAAGLAQRGAGLLGRGGNAGRQVTGPVAGRFAPAGTTVARTTAAATRTPVTAAKVTTPATVADKATVKKPIGSESTKATDKLIAEKKAADDASKPEDGNKKQSKEEEDKGC